MRKKSFLVMVSMCVIVVLTSFSAWAVPGLINYQGKLTDDAGNPLDGDYEMQFLLYNVASGGSSLWDETQTVVVGEGIYNVKLGEVSSFPPFLFEGDNLYLEMVVETETMTPRQRLTSVAYAMKAHLAEGVVAGAINTTMIANGAVASNNIQGGATIAEITDDDGSCSGLDADLLDWLHSSNFATAGHTHDSRYYTQAQVDSIVASQVSSLEARITQLETLLTNVTRSDNDIYFTGVNVHIRSGSGNTDGAANGLGNLIVGYNEERSSSNVRTGSHNIVVGQQHNYSSYGGLVVGYNGTISGIYSSVSGGRYNTASGSYSSVSGGRSNEASVDSSSVSGGYNNDASGVYSSVSGGRYNEASDDSSSVSGGYDNTASNDYSSVSGGIYNTASGSYSSVSGGYNNEASGSYSGVNGGGHNNEASGSYSSVSGGGNNTASGSSSSVSGGHDNTASGSYSSVSGGSNNTASGDDASVSGGRNNKAIGQSSSVTGGGGENDYDGNLAVGRYSAILGGLNNMVGDGDRHYYDGEDRYYCFTNSSPDEGIGEQSTISGGNGNWIEGDTASISGGRGNAAGGIYTSVTGGRANTADGTYTSVTGGRSNSVDGIGHSISGGYNRGLPINPVHGGHDWRAAGLIEYDVDP